MTHLRLALALIATAAAALPLSAQQNRRSPHETISTVIGDRPTGYRVTVVYGRPYTKDPGTGATRKIWGGLVPSETGTSKLAISTDVGGWGVPVDETNDLARVDLKRDALEKQVDQLTMAIEKDPAGGGVLRLLWENTQFSVPFKATAPHIDFPAASPTATYKQRVGLTDVEVVYSR